VGRYVGVSLLRSALTMQATRLVWVDGEGRGRGPANMRSGGITGLHPTRSGQALYISANTPHFWKALCELTGLAEARERPAPSTRCGKRAEHEALLVPRLREALQGAHRARVGGALRGERVPWRGGPPGRGHVSTIRRWPREGNPGELRAPPGWAANRGHGRTRVHFGGAPAATPGSRRPELGQQLRSRSWPASATPPRRSSGSAVRGAVVAPEEGARGHEPRRPSSCAASCSCPASRPELFAKALAGDAERDLLRPGGRGPRRAERPRPRRVLHAFLRQSSPRPAGKIVIVRVKRAHERRTSRPTWPRWPARVVDMINLPKPESADDRPPPAGGRASRGARRCERTSSGPIGILANIESPRGLPGRAAEIAGAHPPRGRPAARARRSVSSHSGSTARMRRRCTPCSSRCGWPRREAGLWACDTVYGAGE